MQIVFQTHLNPKDYIDGSCTCEYPDAPSKCPFKDCGLPIVMRKNGFYCRCLITVEFNGTIKIRRYKCGKCGRTVSMLPSFCLAFCTYGVDIIVDVMQRAVDIGSVRKAARESSTIAICFTRRHIALYLSRLRQNRALIQFCFHQISPGSVSIGDSPGETAWTRSILLGIRQTPTTVFNAEFHKATGMSFMSTQNRIA